MTALEPEDMTFVDERCADCGDREAALTEYDGRLLCASCRDLANAGD